MTKSRGINRPKWRPLPWQIEFVRQAYATAHTAHLAEVDEGDYDLGLDGRPNSRRA